MTEPKDLIVVEGDAVRGEAARVETTQAPVQGAWYQWTRPEHCAKRDAAGNYVKSTSGNFIYEDVIETDLVCVTHVGSNYVEVSFLNRATRRVHADRWGAEFVPEPNANAILASEIARHQQRSAQLLDEVRALTLRLGVGERPTIAAAAEETGALVRSASTQPVEEYKAALVKAKKEDLPMLFKQIEEVNEQMAMFMKSQLIPLQTQAQQLRPIITQVERRIHSVELYAGLTEQVVEVRGGAPADYAERIRLFQRRAYMDEECLANYRTGGMTFTQIADFDRWMSEPANFERLLPFPRCVLAMQVRRKEKHREFQSLRAYISFVHSGEQAWDKYTFLYLRNGDRLYRLRTSLDFGAQLFPDLDQQALAGDLVARMSHQGRVDELITPGEYEGRKAADEAARREYAAEQAALPKAQRSLGYYSSFRDSEYHRWTPDSVYYDDISAYVAEQVRQHNQLALVLQGLLDRSLIWHPHPAWQLYTGEGFAQAFELIYDDTRAMVAGDAPDFEAYRARLNASLAKGSVTTGQWDAWLEHEAEKENAKRERSWRLRDSQPYTRFKPYGDPGPGFVATVDRLGTGKAGRQVTYRWVRPRASFRRFDGYNDIPRTFTCPVARVLNVSAYTPGDFRQFFADPRTRAEYLQWAPLLLDAEEYHAGNLLPGVSERERGGNQHWVCAED